MEYYIVYFKSKRGEMGVGSVTIKCEYLTDDIIHDLEAELKREDRLDECFIINAIALGERRSE